ncbi:MAG TPA: DUF937 domain-containing protein [Demequinaceae bacterium]
MTDINDLFAQLPIGEIAKELGVSKDEAAKGVALALPALVGGLHANASDPKGAASLLTALEGKDTSLVEGSISLADVDTADGTKIVKHIFGAATPDVAAKLGGASALGSGMMKKLLPILAPIVLAFVVKQMTGSKAKTTTPSSGGLQDILGGILGSATGGGSSSGGGIGDILGQVLGGAMSGGSSKASTGNAITDILGGLLGGGTK